MRLFSPTDEGERYRLTPVLANLQNDSDEKFLDSLAERSVPPLPRCSVWLRAVKAV
jgi:hypothetical protein